MLRPGNAAADQPETYRHRMKCALCLGLFFAVCLAHGATPRSVELAAGTALFAQPTSQSAVIGIMPRRAVMAVEAARRVLLKHNPAVPNRFHPLTLDTIFYRVRLPGGGEAWASPDLRYDVDSGRIVPRNVPSITMIYVVQGAAVVLFLLLWVMFRQGDLHRLVHPTGGVTPSRPTLIAWGLLLIGIYWLILALVLFLAGDIVARPTDELDYFRIARDILAGRRPEDWCFNISVAILYIPLILVTGAREYLDIARPLLLFESVLLTPVCFLLVFAILGQLTKAWRRAWLATLLLIIVPLVYCPIEFHADSVFKACVSLPLFNVGSYHLYYLFVWYGRNGLSDTPAMTFFLLTVWLSVRGLTGPPRARHIAGTAVVFGLACFLRINNIYLAPLVAYGFWRHETAGSWTWARLARRAALALGVFLIVFSPQAIANFLEFGSPFTFPYVLHSNGAARGFDFMALPGGIRFLAGTNFLFLVCCLTGLIFTPPSATRRVLALWVFPMFLFFCGYVVVGASPMRFTLPLYGGMIGAFISAPFWLETTPRERWIGVLLVALNAVLSSPCARLAPPFALNLDLLEHGRALALGLEAVTAAGSFVLALRLRPPLRVALCFFLALFHLGATSVAVLLAALLLLRELYAWAREVAGSIRRLPAHPGAGR